MKHLQARQEMFAGEEDPMHEETEVDFCRRVGLCVAEQYELDDGADLCFNLLEMGVISEMASVDEAARIVAQHLLQA